MEKQKKQSVPSKIEHVLRGFGLGLGLGLGLGVALAGLLLTSE